MHPLQDFINGFSRFRKKFVEGETGIFQTLVTEGQSPKALVIACSDSRVDPALILDCNPGDIFVVRNVANLVPAFTAENSYASVAAPLEFGLLGLKIPHIIVLGHSLCGGIQAALDKAIQKDTSINNCIDQWVSHASNAAAQTVVESGDLAANEQHGICGRKSILQSLENLKTYPWIKELLNDNKVTIDGWYFQLEDASLEGYCEASGGFKNL